ncbi:MAG: hypothetical protein C0623_09520 [Desulfuromonas sp.]|nr:MAG: hypothetical protein C0623_09520 [Desulfuromonas sp.]
MAELSDNIAKIQQLLKSEQEEERLGALHLVDRKNANSYLAQLYTAFTDSSWRVRKEATEIFLLIPRVEEHIEEIIRFLYSEDNAGLRNTAVEILIRLGRFSVPPLIREIKSEDQDVRKFALDILGEIPDDRSIPAMIEALKDDDSNVRAAAAENLGKLGASEAVTPLLEAMEKPDLLFRFTILEALGQIDASVPVDRLLDYSDDKLLRKALLDCLGRVGDAAAIPFLVQSLSDEMKNVREAAVMALGQISYQARDFFGNVMVMRSNESVTAAVKELLVDGGPSIQKAAISLLSCIGNKDSVSSLLGLIDDPDLREDAVSALVALGRMDTAALLGAWGGVEGRAKAYLAYLYGEVGATSAVDLLLSVSKDPDPEMRQVVIQSLGKVSNEKALPVLIEALGDDVEEICETALQALSLFGERYREQTVKSVSPLLEHSDPQIRMYAVTVLGRLDGDEIEEHLAFAIKDESAQVRSAAIRSIEGKTGAGHLPALMLALTDEENEVRALAAETLGLTGDHEVVDPLCLALQDEDMWVRSAAVRSLGRLCGADAAPMIAPVLMDPVGMVSIAVLETLDTLGLCDFQDYLLRALEHNDDEVVSAALKFLQYSGSRDWIRGVEEKLLNHSHQEIRLEAARVLAEIEGPACCNRLEIMMQNEDNDIVRQELQYLLSGLKQGIE